MLFFTADAHTSSCLSRLGAIDYRLVDEMVDPPGAWDMLRWTIGWKIWGSILSQRFCWVCNFSKWPSLIREGAAISIYFTGWLVLKILSNMACFHSTGMMIPDEPVVSRLDTTQPFSEELVRLPGSRPSARWTLRCCWFQNGPKWR